jgi:type I restriction enzyme, S subunit
MIFNGSKFNNHWKTKSLRDLGEFNRGKSKHRPRNDQKLFENGKYPLIQTGDVKKANLFINEHSSVYSEFGLAQSKLWPENTLCITIAANIAETALLSYEMCFPDSVVGFIADQNECSEIYMHYVFTYIKRSIQERIQGSIQDNINLEYLTGLRFRIPEIKEREAIENVLYTLDAKIELNNKINAELESMAKLIYNYWFVQFDFPDENGKPYKSSGGKMVYNDRLNREIPQGWINGELQDIANITMGQSPSGDSYNEDRKGDVFYQGCTDFGLRFPTNRKFTTKPTRFAKRGDILLSVRAPVGTMNIANEDCCIGRGLAALNSKDGSITYLDGVLQHMKQIFDLRNASGTTFGSITKGDLFSIPVIIPDNRTLQRFREVTNNMFEKQNLIGSENRILEDLRDWLLPMLMNGQVTIKD